MRVKLLVFLVFCALLLCKPQPANKLNEVLHTSISKNGLYTWPLKNIESEGILPFVNEKMPHIGLIDSGIDLNNVFLMNTDIMQFVLDAESQHSLKAHGTMVAGLLVANGDGEQHPGGVVPKARIISVQVGTDAGMDIDQLISAIKFVVEKGARVINISYGSLESSSELDDIIRATLSKGVVIVASSGNDGKPQNRYPAKHDGVIAVSALDKNNIPASYSNYETTNIFAPGEYLLTTGTNDYNYTWFKGSSAAAPLVTAICSILKFYNPSWDSFEIKKILLDNSEKKVHDGKEINIINMKKIKDYLLSLDMQI